MSRPIRKLWDGISHLDTAWTVATATWKGIGFLLISTIPVAILAYVNRQPLWVVLLAALLSLLTLAWTIVAVLIVAEHLRTRGSGGSKQPSWNPNMETISHKAFMNETVEQDGKKFVGCRFSNVTFRYKGHGPSEFFDCGFGAQGTLALDIDSMAMKQYLILTKMLEPFPNAKIQLFEKDSAGNLHEIVKPIIQVKPDSRRE